VKPAAATRPGAVAPDPTWRALRLDALRGVAIVWMVGFHFVFDLNHFGLLRPPQDFYRDAFWTTQRTLIVSLFLLCAGMGQALALQAGQGWPRFWRRWSQVAACALLVSVGSALMFPRSWISFGVLHGIAVMLLLLRLVAPRLPLAGLLGLGAVALVLPWAVQHPWFDSRLTNWVGLVTRKPVTEDFVPVLPWLGAMAWGLAAGRWLLQHRPNWLGGPVPAAAGALVWLGQRPLTVYMLHQPLLIGGLMLWQALWQALRT
jgi:uncharacterized membrane protein